MSWVVPDGFQIAATDAGIAKGDRDDLVLVVSDAVSPALAAFTTNQFVAAPVAMSREHLRQTEGLAKAILVNAGNANAATGAAGDEHAMQCARWVADLVGCDVLEVLLFSTGVIGEPLPVDKIEAALPALQAGLTRDSSAVERAARAIMTTDTTPKITQRTMPLADGAEAHLLGFAKGSGMIHPNLATMLGFFLTELDTGRGTDVFLRGAIRESFEHVSIDGDTSTNDAVLLWSSGKTQQETQEEAGFFKSLVECSIDLAKAIARDGEGASKFIEVKVSGAMTPDHALACARAIGTSLLVRTAVRGEDPNWGRVLAAAGRSGVQLDTRKVRIGIGDVCLFEKDEPRIENEATARNHLQGKEVLIWAELASGGCEASFWTCDLTEDYIRINADYRT